MAEQVRYQVYIIESPSDTDIFNGVSAGATLRKGLEIAGIPAKYRLVVNLARFGDAITEMVLGFQDNPDLLPILHLIAHGNHREVGLTSGALIPLAKLGELLGLLNQALDGDLVVCVSACKGFTLVRSGLKGDQPPYAALIGNIGEPSWADNIVGFTAFYHLLGKGKTIKEAVEGLKSASGNTEFRTIDGDDIKRLKDLAAKVDPVRLKEVLEKLRDTKQHGS